MTSTHYDVIVLGTGGVGSAALWQLARRGLRVLGLDRFPPGHDRGSSHGQTRIIRQAYFEHPDYVPLLRHAYELWNDLEQESHQKLLFPVGLVQVGKPDGEVISGVRKSAALHHLHIENWSAAEAKQHLPGFVIPADMEVIFEPAAGYLLVEDCVRAQAAAATNAGAELQSGHTVKSWRADQDGVTVITDKGEFHADRLIITAGAWAGDFLPDLGILLTVLRKSLFWFQAENLSALLSPSSPTFLYDLGTTCFYGFPPLDARGMKVAEHSGGTPIMDPLNLDRSLDLVDLAHVQEFVRDYLPSLSEECQVHAVCLYTMSPDGHFIVDVHPQHPQVCFAAGLSGHGFKFAPVLGEILAELSMTGSTAQPIDFLSLRRFHQQ